MAVNLVAHLHDQVELFLQGRNTAAVDDIMAKYGSVSHFKSEGVDNNAFTFDVIILAVSDDQIESVAKNYLNFNAIICHTSGTVSTDVFADLGCRNYGVIYPLQTLNKNKIADLKVVPICIHSSNIESLFIISKVSKYIGGSIFEINDEQRGKLHLMAVMTNNFMNHLAKKASAYLVENKLSFDIIKPLLNETFEKIMKDDFTQTGPAKRNDQKVIQKHLSLLQEDAHLQEIYESITKSIIQHENNR